jgi:hypothetical protein
MLDFKSGNVAEHVWQSWQPKSPTPKGSFGVPRSEKRKAEAVTGLAEHEEPRKTSITPSMGKSRLEEKMMMAKKKLAAATERNRKLEEERQAAKVIKSKSDEVREPRNILGQP